MIHPKALVETDHIGTGTNVWAFAHVMPGVRIGDQVNIGDHAFIESGVSIGNNVTIKNGVCIWEGITIEDDVFVGPQVVFTNDRYPRSPRAPHMKQRYADKSNWLESIVIRQGCSIGAGATVCPGVELGAYSMIAAASVVTRNVAPYSLVRGTPARHAGYVCRCGQKLSAAQGQDGCDACQLTTDHETTSHPITTANS